MEVLGAFDVAAEGGGPGGLVVFRERHQGIKLGNNFIIVKKVGWGDWAG